MRQHLLLVARLCIMSAAMEALRARQIARRAARLPTPAASFCAPVRTPVVPRPAARRAKLDVRIEALWGAQSRPSVACRSSATADDEVLDVDADVLDDRVPITVRNRSSCICVTI